MADPVITTNDNGALIWRGAEYQDDTFTAGGAGTTPEGTILARDSVSGKLIPYVKGGVTNEDGIPKAVLTYDVVAAGAGDLAVRPAIKGEFIKERLIIAADGDDINIDAAVKDLLRDYGLLAVNVEQLNNLDNQ